MREPDTVKAYVKAYEAPGTLTLEEQVFLDALYANAIHVHVSRNAYMVEAGMFELVDLDSTADVAARMVFSSNYGREWWTRRRMAFFPGIRALMDAAAERNPESSAFEDAAIIKEFAQQRMEE